MADTGQASTSGGAASSGTTSNAPEIKIQVKTMQPSTYELTVCRTATISTVKQMLSVRASVPPSRQRLIFRGRVCEDTQTMQEIGIQEGDTMHLVIRPEDAPPVGASSRTGQASTITAPAGGDTAVTDDINRFLQGVMSSLLPGMTGMSVGFGPDGSMGPMPPNPTQGPRGRAGGIGQGRPSTRPGASGTGTGGAATGGSSGGQGTTANVTWMVPHMLTSIHAYLQQLQAADFNPGPVALSSLALVGTPTDEQFTTLTESIQNILEGSYLPQQLQQLLQQSQTDPVGRTGGSAQSSTATASTTTATGPGRSGANEGASAGASMSTTTPPTGTSARSAADQTSAGAAGTTAAAGAGTTAAGAARGVRGTGGRAQAGGRAARNTYRYMPLAVAALGELLRQTDIHLAANLQPHLREMSTQLVAGVTQGQSARMTTQATIRALASSIQASAALLAELSRVAAAVALGVSGNILPLVLNTTAALQPDGSRPAMPRMLPRTVATPEMPAYEEVLASEDLMGNMSTLGSFVGGPGMWGMMGSSATGGAMGGMPNVGMSGPMGMPMMASVTTGTAPATATATGGVGLPSGNGGGMPSGSMTIDLGQISNIHQLGPMVQSVLGGLGIPVDTNVLGPDGTGPQGTTPASGTSSSARPAAITCATPAAAGARPAAAGASGAAARAAGNQQMPDVNNQGMSSAISQWQPQINEVATQAARMIRSQLTGLGMLDGMRNRPDASATSAALVAEISQEAMNHLLATTIRVVSRDMLQGSPSTAPSSTTTTSERMAHVNRALEAVVANNAAAIDTSVSSGIPTTALVNDASDLITHARLRLCKLQSEYNNALRPMLSQLNATLSQLSIAAQSGTPVPQSQLDAASQTIQQAQTVMKRLDALLEQSGENVWRGPSQSANDTSGGTSAAAGALMHLEHQLQSFNDVVRVNSRGSGSSVTTLEQAEARLRDSMAALREQEPSNGAGGVVGVLGQQVADRQAQMQQAFGGPLPPAAAGQPATTVTAASLTDMLTRARQAAAPTTSTTTSIATPAPVSSSTPSAPDAGSSQADGKGSAAPAPTAMGGPRGLGLGLRGAAPAKKAPKPKTAESTADVEEAGRSVLQALQAGAGSRQAHASNDNTSAALKTAATPPPAAAGAGIGGSAVARPPPDLSGLMNMMGSMMGGGAAGGTGSRNGDSGGGGGGTGGLLQMASQIASDPNMAPAIDQMMSSLMGGGGAGGAGANPFGSLLGSLMGGLGGAPSGRGGAGARGASGAAATPPISDDVIPQSINDAADVERWQAMLDADSARQREEPPAAGGSLSSEYAVMSQAAGSGGDQGTGGALGALFGGL